MKKKIFSILFALILILSLSLVTAVVSANPGGPWYVNATTGDNVLDGLASTWTDTNGNGVKDAGDTGPFKTIGKAISSAGSGDTINVAAGTYNENVVINKHLTLSGAGVTTIIQPPLAPASGYGIEIMKEGSGPSASDHTVVKDLRVTGGYNGVEFHHYCGNKPCPDTISHVTLQNLQCDHNIASGAYYGDEGSAVHFEKYTRYSDIVIDNLTATDNAGFGINSGSGVTSIDDLTVTGGYFARNAYPGLELTTVLANNIIINGGSFENNGIGKDTEGDIVITGSNGNLSITDATITSSGAETGLRISGGTLAPAGTVTLTNVTINGTQATCVANNPWGPYPSAAIVISRFKSLPNIHFTNVNLNSTAPVGLFLGTIYDTPTAPTLDLTGISFNGTYGQLITLGRHGNNPSYQKANVNVDARNAIFTGLTDNFAIEDKITHKLDDADLGLVTRVANNVYVTPLSGSIQRGVDAIISGGTVNVAAGTYTEQVSITDKSLTIQGESEAGVIVQAATSQTGTGNVFTINAAGKTVTLQYMTIRHGDYGIRSSAGNVNVLHCTFYHNGWDGTGVPSTPTKLATKTFYTTKATDGGAIRIEKSAASEVAYCTVYENDRGIRFQDSSNGDIHDNVSRNNIQSGIYLASGSYGVSADGCTNTVVRNNEAYANMNNGILVVGGNNNTVEGNQVHDNWNSGVMAWCPSQLTIQGNTITNNNLYAFNGEGNDGDALGGGIWAEGGSPYSPSFGLKILNNTISGNQKGRADKSIGVRLFKSTGLPNNDITGNDFLNHEVDVLVGLQAATSVVNYNNFDGVGIGVQNDDTSAILNATNNWWGSPTGPSRQLPNGKWVGKGDRVSVNVDYIPWLPLPIDFWNPLHPR